MKSLWSKTSRGGRKWDRFKKQENLSELEFDIRPEIKSAVVLDDFGNELTQVSANEKISILGALTRSFPTLRGSAPSIKVKIEKNDICGWLKMSMIRNPAEIQVTAAEDKVFESIKHEFHNIYTAKGPFTLYIDGQHRIENVVNVDTPFSNPKADFVVMNDQNSRVGFISHKRSGGATAFQQYGGITPKASGLKKHGSPEIIREVDNFIYDLGNFLTENPEAVKVSRIWRKVECTDLIGFSVFGPKYGSEEFSVNNVNLIGQGDANIKSFRDGFNLTFSESNYHNNSEFFKHLKGGLEACFVARRSPTENRRIVGIEKEVCVENRRGMIVPKAFVTGVSVEI